MTYKVTVRYGAMRLVGEFSTQLDSLKRGDSVAVKTTRGTEAGTTIDGPHQVAESDHAPGGEVLRPLTDEDDKELERLEKEAIPAEMAFCRERIKALELGMKLVTAEHLLGGEKIIFYFLADGRVDFRQLVKDIARQYRTRIELRQIGVRDEARLMSEYGHCGQKMCCRTFMKTLEPVTMRMAKSQKATLDPSKISGVCGRLMCCLRYEDPLYRELKGKLPKRGAWVESPRAEGKVVDVDVLSQTITVLTPSSNFIRVKADEITAVRPKGAKKPSTERKPSRDKAREKGRPPEKKGSTEGPRTTGDPPPTPTSHPQRKGPSSSSRRRSGRRSGRRRDPKDKGPGDSK